MNRRVMLLVLDGWGINPRKEANAIEMARTPFWHGLLKDCPNTALEASGASVGLRTGLMGNSEVGHMTLGAGRVIWQDITRIDKAIDDGTLFSRPSFVEAAAHARKNRGTLHLLGLVSDGGVHSDEKHYFALLDFARREKLPHAFHVLTDGRDTPPKSGIGYVRRLVERGALVSTLMGRYWGMDRDKRWERTGRAYHALTLGEGTSATDPVRAVEEAYARGETDEFIQPIAFPGERIRDGDALVCFNFRADRMRQITQALMFDDFTGFERRVRPRVAYSSMTSYHEDWTLPVAFPPERHAHILGGVFAEHGVPQLRIAETEKYAHVTFFFNAGSDATAAGEERILVPSPKVATYDLKPEMSAFEVTDRVVQAIDSDRFQAIIQNYANPDMVGHSGVLDATIRACEVIDQCLERVVSAAHKRDWIVLITGDHGNCEQMIDYETGQPHTYHTTNPVPLVVIGDGFRGATLRSGGSFRDVAPTILEIAGLPQPSEMTGRSLLG